MEGKYTAEDLSKLRQAIESAAHSMRRGGKREGAGRKATGRKTVSVCWRVTPEVKDWLTNRAAEKGVSIGNVIDELVRTFNEVQKGHIVMQKDFSKITVDFKAMEEGMSRPDLNGYILSQPRKVLDDFIEKMNDNPAMIGLIDRDNHI